MTAANPAAVSSDDTLEIPDRIAEIIASFRRALHHAEHDENKVAVFRLAARDLMALVNETPDQIAQLIVDELHLMAADAGIDPDQAQEIMANPTPPAEPAAGITVEDFFAYMPTHSYIFTASREMWPATSVNARIAPISCDGKMLPANQWLDRNRPVEQATWAPGFPMLISGRLISSGGWIERDGVSCFNLYRPPTIKLGNAQNAGPWRDHVDRVYGDDADHIVQWLAHRVQHPDVKINHALVLGGGQGIGKDTILVPIKYAVGPWNFIEVSPTQIMGRFTGYLKSVILRISEARDLGDTDRFKFYDHIKTLTASPPDVIRCDEKNLREHDVFNVSGVIVTTNYKTDGIFLPPDDRRHFVAWSDRTKDDFSEGYWRGLYGWYEREGNQHVAAYLSIIDITGFDPKAPPPKTAAFWSIVDANQAPENAELADVLDKMGNPDATTIARIAVEADGALAVWLTDRKNSRQIPHRLEQCDLVRVRNDLAKDGQWVVNGRRQAIYTKKTLSLREQIRAAKELIDR